MDSITQIVLGAAVGEKILGKKIGRRAMVWGAVGGTIPDLDILLDGFMSEAESLVAHRGFSHSLLFACLGALVFGWLVYQLYKSPYYKWISFIGRSLISLAIIVFLGYSGGKTANLFLIIASVVLAIISFVRFKKEYLNKDIYQSEANLKDWILLFFMAFVTHVLLDCFTMYGTQVFAPFSDYRVAFSSISVADPMYTLPFILCLAIAACLPKGTIKRRNWNYAGLIISSCYLMFTVWNKQGINSVFEQQLAKQNISYNRCITGPTILNNVLWSCTIESDSVFYQGQYSLFDRSDIVFHPIPKNYELLEGHHDDQTVEIVRWFTKGFFNVIVRRDGRLQMNDLRYGTFRGKGDGEDDFIFRFIIEQLDDGTYKMSDSEGGPPDDNDRREMIGQLWERIKGI